MRSEGKDGWMDGFDVISVEGWIWIHTSYCKRRLFELHSSALAKAEGGRNNTFEVDQWKFKLGTNQSAKVESFVAEYI